MSYSQCKMYESDHKMKWDQAANPQWAREESKEKEMIRWKKKILHL